MSADLAELIRQELRKGSYQMPGDELPYQTQAANIAAILTASGYGQLTPPMPQWAVLHENGELWNYYHSREAAEVFVKDMRTVDVNMVAVSRDYYPATYGEWEPVA